MKINLDGLNPANTFERRLMQALVEGEDLPVNVHFHTEEIERRLQALETAKPSSVAVPDDPKIKALEAQVLDLMRTVQMSLQAHEDEKRKYGSKAFYIQTLSSTIAFAGTVEESAALYVFASSFVLARTHPVSGRQLLFREPLATYGIQLGDARFGWRAVAVVTPVMIVSAYPSASMSEFRAEYPINPLAGESAVHFLEHALLYLFFYLGWEFCFRGFVQFGLRASMVDWNAILVQTALSCVLHIGKPAGEIYSSILGALVWGVVAFRSRSLLYPVLTH